MKPIDFEQFGERTGIKRQDVSSLWHEAKCVVSLRNLVRIESVLIMPKPYLQKLIWNIGLESDPAAKPYDGCEIMTGRIDSRHIEVAQTFVERKKCAAILEYYSEAFEGFCTTRGFAKLTALIVLGRTAEGDAAAAHYIPPIIEEPHGGGSQRLLDGTHRNYVGRSTGTSLESIVIRGVKTPFPCTPQPWSAVQPVDVKPPREQRFMNLDTKYFRDVKHIGIDG